MPDEAPCVNVPAVAVPLVIIDPRLDSSVFTILGLLLVSLAA